MSDLLADRRTVRRGVTVAVVELLVAFSGCAGLGANGPGGEELERDSDPEPLEILSPPADWFRLRSV